MKKLWRFATVLVACGGAVSACGLIAQTRDLELSRDAATPITSASDSAPDLTFDSSPVVVLDSSQDSGDDGWRAPSNPCEGSAFCETFEEGSLAKWDFVSGTLRIDDGGFADTKAASFAIEVGDRGGFADKRLTVSGGSFSLEAQLSLRIVDADGGLETMGQTLTVVMRPGPGGTSEAFLGVRHHPKGDTMWISYRATPTSGERYESVPLSLPRGGVWSKVRLEAVGNGGVMSMRCLGDGVLLASASYFGPAPTSVIAKIGHDINPPTSLQGNYRIDNVRYDTPLIPAR